MIVLLIINFQSYDSYILLGDVVPVVLAIFPPFNALRAIDLFDNPNSFTWLVDCENSSSILIMFMLPVLLLLFISVGVVMSVSSGIAYCTPIEALLGENLRMQ